MGLSNIIDDPSKKEKVVNDSLKLIDESVAAASGISGMALKAAYGVVKGIAPTYIAGAVERLLPEALPALDPMWNEGVQKGDPVGYLTQNKSSAADAMLSVTDSKIERSSNSVVKGAYGKLRNSAKSYVETAMPGLAKIIGNYAS